MNEDDLLRRLGRIAEKERRPNIDVVEDVLSAITQRPEPEANERLPLWFAGGAIATAAVITFATLPAWTTLNSPWASIIHAFPGGLL